MVTLLFVVSLFAQDPKVQEQIEELKERVEKLEREKEELKKQGSGNPLNALNPSLAVVGNFLWRLDNHDIVGEDGEELDDKIYVREVELDMRAAIDPYADGMFVLGLEAEVPGEFEVDVEEFHVRIKSLPIGFWEKPPLGTKITLGRFRTAFGRLNVVHLHDLPAATRGIAIEEFLGEEGQIGDGAWFQFFLPSPGDTALELALQVMQGGNANVCQASDEPCFLANLNFFWPISDDFSLNTSLIGFVGWNTDDEEAGSQVVSLDVLFKWKPLKQGEYRSFIVGAQVFKSLSHEFEVDTDGDGVPDDIDETKPLGFYLWVQYQFFKELYVGAKYDFSEFLTDDESDHSRVQVYASYYFSEFFRVRLVIERTWSDDEEEDELLSALFEVNVVFGSHPPHPFWVNR